MRNGRGHFGPALATAILLGLVASGGETTDALSAKTLPNGDVQLENEFLRCVFDPADRAAAKSIFSKPAGKEMAVVGRYRDRFHWR